MKFSTEKDLQKKFYLNLIAAFSLGFAIFLFSCGLYNIITTLQVNVRGSYVILIFTLLFIFFSVFLENRGVKVPYLFIGSLILTSVSTLMVICVYIGWTWIWMKEWPSEDTLIIGLSISMLAAFVIVKILGSLTRGAE